MVRLFRTDTENWIRVVSNSSDFFNIFRAIQPAKDRYVSEGHYFVLTTRLEFIRDICSRMGLPVDTTDLHSEVASIFYTPTNKNTHAVLYLIEGAPPEVVRASYRALSKIHHPDVGGDRIRFEEINEAYKKLQ